MAVCVTCGVIKNWKELQCGHFVDGRNNSVLYDERLCFPQCFKCNMKGMGCLAGNKIRFFLFMKSKGYTDEQLKEFDNLKHQIKKMSWKDYQDVYNKYKSWLL